MTIFIKKPRLLFGAALSAVLLFAASAAMAEPTDYDANQAAQACAADLHLDPASAAGSDCVRATLWNEQNLGVR